MIRDLIGETNTRTMRIKYSVEVYPIFDELGKPILRKTFTCSTNATNKIYLKILDVRSFYVYYLYIANKHRGTYHGYL